MMDMALGNMRVGRGQGAAAGLVLDNMAFLLLNQQVMNVVSGSDPGGLQAVVGGDVAAWQEFVLKYADFVYAAIHKYCDDRDEKMAVFLHILEKLREDRFARLRGFEGKAKLSTWLTIVARRLAIDFLRAKYGRDFSLKKIRVHSYDTVPAFLKQAAHHATPEAEMAGSEQRQARDRLEDGLQRALQGLSDRESMAIQLVYFKGMKIKEAGKLLQENSIYKFVARALAKLRNEMESEPRFRRADVPAALGEESHE